MSNLIGGYEIKVSKNMPQQVATAFGNIMTNLLGAQYNFVAYLGSQPVNGTNHAVLAEQLVVTGEDVKNLVLVILNEKPGSIAGKDFALVGIIPVIDGGGKFGGTNIEATALTEETQAVWDKAFEGFVGSNVKPIMLLGTKVVKGVEYKFLASVTPVTPNPKEDAQIVTINGLTNKVEFSSIL